jgi:crotonobetainyl-CoA:carnitine CoA-transferase CaiB-like acyl-CoA transferase
MPVCGTTHGRRLDRPPPLLGQHTDTILGDDLGLGPQELRALRLRKVV